MPSKIVLKRPRRIQITRKGSRTGPSRDSSSKRARETETNAVIIGDEVIIVALTEAGVAEASPLSLVVIETSSLVRIRIVGKARIGDKTTKNVKGLISSLTFSGSKITFSLYSKRLKMTSTCSSRLLMIPPISSQPWRMFTKSLTSRRVEENATSLMGY